MTKAQREYTEQVVTVEETPKSAYRLGRWTVYLVTHNSLMATKSKRVIERTNNYRYAALVAQGYANGAEGIKLSSRVEVF